MNGFIKDFLHLLPAETAHNMAIWGLKKYPALLDIKTKQYDILKTKLFGLEFTNPIGLAAGFDKNAECLDALSQIGFGLVEVGTSTPRPQAGNPKPRIFRLSDDKAIINRLGFNNKGAQEFSNNLLNTEQTNVKIGANIGKNKDTEDIPQDYIYMLDRVAGNCDYVTVNISSPNTPGLRKIQDKEYLNDFLGQIAEHRKALETVKKIKIPLLIKVAPDLNLIQVEDIVELGLKYKISGIIIGNTTIGRQGLVSSNKNQQGGLSGKPLLDFSSNILEEFYKLLRGRIPLVGVGGVSTGKDAFNKILKGANLVQLYTALIYEGLEIAEKIKHELNQLVIAEGVDNIQDLVGAGIK